jgi:hypothetical protein
MTDSADTDPGQPTPPRAGYRATLERGGKTATGFVVPSEVVASLGTSKRPSNGCVRAVGNASGTLPRWLTTPTRLSTLAC